MAGGHFISGKIDYAGANTPGWLSNLGISLSGGVLSIVDAQGAALTQSNPGWVTVPSTTAGQMVTLKVTVGGSFNDDAHASSDLTNVGFGITEAAHWANDMPFFLYVVNRANSNIDGADGSSAFFLARDWRMSTTPSSADDIGDTGAIPANDSQTVILILDDVTVANYTSLPCQLVGSLRMQWSTTTDDWTVQALGNTDGLGFPQVRKTLATTWTFPQGQNGADATSYLFANGGTAPVFGNNEYKYVIYENGNVEIHFDLDNDGGTDGSGAVTTFVATPYATTFAYTNRVGCGYVSSATGGEEAFVASMASGASRFSMYGADGAGTFEHGDFTNGARAIAGTMVFKAY